MSLPVPSPETGSVGVALTVAVEDVVTAAGTTYTQCED